MKHNSFLKIWDIAYPVLLYYVVSNIIMSLAVLALGITEINYAANYTMLQTMAAAVSLPVLYRFYRKDQLLFTVFHQRTGNAFKATSRRQKLVFGLLVFLCGALSGLVLNHLIGAIGLEGMSPGYQNVTAHFFAGDIFFEVLGVGILVPVVEELLYRGIVYGRLSDWVGIPKAAVISTLIFGGLHMNVVQLLYAGLMGLLLVFFLEKTHNLYGAVLGHMGANLLTVLRVETGCLDWMERSPAVFWGCTLGMAAVSLGIIGFLQGKLWAKEQKEQE